MVLGDQNVFINLIGERKEHSPPEKHLGKAPETTNEKKNHIWW